MEDLTLKHDDRRKYITGYDVTPDNLYIYFADGTTINAMNNENNLKNIENIMKNQALDNRYVAAIDKKIKVHNIIISSSCIAAMGSCLAIGAFALMRKEDALGAPFMILTTGVLTDYVFSRKRDRLCDLKALAEKYRFVAENLDSLDGITMNNMDNYSFSDIKKKLEKKD